MSRASRRRWSARGRWRRRLRLAERIFRQLAGSVSAVALVTGKVRVTVGHGTIREGELVALDAIGRARRIRATDGGG